MFWQFDELKIIKLWSKEPSVGKAKTVAEVLSHLPKQSERTVGLGIYFFAAVVQGDNFLYELLNLRIALYLISDLFRKR